MSGRQCDAGLLRIERLHQHLTAARPTAGSASHLREKLKRPLRGAEVRQCKAHVCVDHADQRHVGKSSPLAIICVPSRMWINPWRKADRTRLVAAGQLHRVAVHAPHDEAGKFLARSPPAAFRCRAPDSGPTPGRTSDKAAAAVPRSRSSGTAAICVRGGRSAPRRRTAIGNLAARRGIENVSKIRGDSAAKSPARPSSGHCASRVRGSG